MKDRYDFSKGKRGRVLPPEPEPEGKTRITIRLDQDVVDRFFRMAEESGGTIGYQTLSNAALRAISKRRNLQQCDINFHDLPGLHEIDGGGNPRCYSPQTGPVIR